jgi:hypothetical protein
MANQEAYLIFISKVEKITSCENYKILDKIYKPIPIPENSKFCWKEEKFYIESPHGIFIDCHYHILKFPKKTMVCYHNYIYATFFALLKTMEMKDGIEKNVTISFKGELSYVGPTDWPHNLKFYFSRGHFMMAEELHFKVSPRGKCMRISDPNRYYELYSN